MFSVDTYLAKDNDVQNVIDAIKTSQTEISHATILHDNARIDLNEVMAKYTTDEQYRPAVSKLAQQNQSFLSYSGSSYAYPDTNTLPTDVVSKNQAFVEAVFNLRKLQQKKQTLDSTLRQYQSFYEALVRIDTFLENKDADADLKRAVSTMRAYIMQQKRDMAKLKGITLASLTAALSYTNTLITGQLTASQIDSYLMWADRQQGGIAWDDVGALAAFTGVCTYFGFYFTLLGALPPAIMGMVITGIVFFAMAAVLATAAITVALQPRTGLAKELYEVGSVARKISANVQVKQAYAAQLKVLEAYQTKYTTFTTIDKGITSVKEKIIAMVKSDNKQQQKMTTVLSQVNQMLGQFTAEAAETLIRSYNPNPTTNTLFSTKDLDPGTQELYRAIHVLANAVKEKIAEKQAQQERDNIRNFSGMNAFSIV